MKTRILWIIDGLGHGGAERMTLSIMKSFDPERFDLRVCALQVKQGNPIAMELERAGIPVDLVPIPNLRHPANLPKLLKYIRSHNPHIIHTQLEFANVLGNIAAAILGIPSVSTLHTLGAPQKGTEYGRSQIEWACLRNFCTRVIAVSESTRRHHIKYGNIKHDRIVTLYNGIDLSVFDPLNETVRAQKRASLGIPSAATIFVTIAVLREPKGIQYMLAAMPQILESEPSARYLVVGDGPHGDVLKEFTRSHGLESHVTFTGQRTDIHEILAASDVFILPTLIDALPTVLIEAMSAGKAVIASNVGGVPEIVANGISGILIEPAEPLQLVESFLKLAQDKVQRDTMAKAGLKISHEKFDIKKQVEKLTELYGELIQHGR